MAKDRGYGVEVVEDKFFYVQLCPDQNCPCTTYRTDTPPLYGVSGCPDISVRFCIRIGLRGECEKNVVTFADNCT